MAPIPEAYLPSLDKCFSGDVQLVYAIPPALSRYEMLIYSQVVDKSLPSFVLLQRQQRWGEQRLFFPGASRQHKLTFKLFESLSLALREIEIRIRIENIIYPCRNHNPSFV